MMIVSLVFVVLCLGASVYFTIALPAGDENLTFFYLSDVIFVAAAAWFGYNVYSLITKREDD